MKTNIETNNLNKAINRVSNSEQGSKLVEKYTIARENTLAEIKAFTSYAKDAYGLTGEAALVLPEYGQVAHAMEVEAVAKNAILQLANKLDSEKKTTRKRIQQANKEAFEGRVEDVVNGNFFGYITDALAEAAQQREAEMLAQKTENESIRKMVDEEFNKAAEEYGWFTSDSTIEDEDKDYKKANKQAWKQYTRSLTTEQRFELGMPARDTHEEKVMTKLANRNKKVRKQVKQLDYVTEINSLEKALKNAKAGVKVKLTTDDTVKQIW